MPTDPPPRTGRPAIETTGGTPAVDQGMKFEHVQEELERLVDRMESGEQGLEAMMADFQRGQALLAHAKSILDQAEQTLTDLTEKVKKTD